MWKNKSFFLQKNEFTWCKKWNNGVCIWAKPSWSTALMRTAPSGVVKLPMAAVLLSCLLLLLLLLVAGLLPLPPRLSCIVSDNDTPPWSSCCGVVRCGDVDMLLDDTFTVATHTYTALVSQQIPAAYHSYLLLTRRAPFRPRDISSLLSTRAVSCASATQIAAT